MSLPKLERLLQQVAQHYPTLSAKEVEVSWQKMAPRLDALVTRPVTALSPGHGVDRPDPHAYLSKLPVKRGRLG